MPKSFNVQIVRLELAFIIGYCSFFYSPELDNNPSQVSSQQKLVFTILGFHTIPRDTKDNRHSGHVGVPNKRNNQNSFVKSTPTWLP